MTVKCLCCGSSHLDLNIDFGNQPASNRFETKDVESNHFHPLKVGQCQDCMMVQILGPMAFTEAKSHFPWITYNEPEQHLDNLVEQLCKLAGLEKSSRIIGLTYKDDTTLGRLNKLGYENTYRYDVAADLMLDDPCVGLETIQDAYSSSTIARLKEKHGQADLLSVRHILEHAHSPLEFLAHIRELVKPDGYLWFEMPDCSKFIKACDYIFIWEEHITYFSKQMLDIFSKNANLKMLDIFVYPYQFEDSLIGIAQNSNWEQMVSPSSIDLDELLNEGHKFSTGFPVMKEAVRRALQDWKQQNKRVAVFGAGHLAARFLNMFDLKDLVECVIDDHPQKQGLLMPGSRVPIVGSAMLDDVDICLLSLSSDSEKKVRGAKKYYTDRGGIFLSIFSDHEHSIYAVDK